MRADHQRWAIESSASPNAAITVSPARIQTCVRSPEGMALSSIERSNSGGARINSESKTMVTRKPTIMTR